MTGQQIERHYNENIQQYSTPEQVRASHILLKTEGKDDAAVKKQADDLLKRAKGGEDFAALATKYSEDEISAKKGGDLDYFGHGQMQPEFDQAAFAMQPGQISDLVKTQYGYHIIKLVDKKAGTTKSLAEVRQQIEEQLKWEQAQSGAQKLSDKIAGQLTKPSDFDAVARANGLQVRESGFFTRDEPIVGIGLAPNVAARAFDLKEGEVSDAIRTPQGFVFMTVIGKQDPYIPKLDEVKAKVHDDVLKQKAVDGVSDPIVTDTGALLVKMLERKDVTPAELTAGRDALRTELLNDRRNKFYSAYMTKARQRMNIRINRETIAQVVA